MESAKKSGSSRLAVWLLRWWLRPEFWIPTAEKVVQILVENPRPGLQQKIGPAQRPLHLLLLDESYADHLVDRRLHECRANRFPLPSTLAEVRDELAVVADVCFESAKGPNESLMLSILPSPTVWEWG
jgi:hypothetical protein